MILASAGTPGLGLAWVTAAGTVVLVLIALAGWAGRSVWRVFTRLRDFTEDYFGQPARPGVPAQPGVMARLQSVEADVGKVLAETQPNGGGSLRDVVNETRSEVARLRRELDHVRQQVAAIASPGKETG